MKDAVFTMDEEKLIWAHAPAAPESLFADFIRAQAEADFADARPDPHGGFMENANVLHGRALCLIAVKALPEEDFRQACLGIVRRDGRALAFVPDDLQTEEMQEVAVRQNPSALAFISEARRTEKLFMAAAEADPAAALNAMACVEPQSVLKIGKVQPEWDPGWQKMQDVYAGAVADGRMALGGGPYWFRTAKVCEAALERDPMALKDVPIFVMTEEMCRNAARRNPAALQFSPSEAEEIAGFVPPRKDESADAASPAAGVAPPAHAEGKDGRKQNSMPTVEDFAEGLVQSAEKTMQSILAAEEGGTPQKGFPPDYEALARYAAWKGLLPVDADAGEEWSAAGQTQARRLAQLDDLFRTLRGEALAQDPMALQWVPERLRDASMCLDAVLRDRRAVRFVPQNLLAQTCSALFRQRPLPETLGEIASVLGKDTPAESCMLLVEHNGRALRYVPEELKTQEMCEAAVKSFPGAMEWTPEQRRTDALRREAAERDPAAAAFVRSRGDAVSLAAQNPACLQALPGAMLTKAFLEAVDVERNGDPKEKAAHRRRLAMAGPDGLALIPPEHIGAGLRTLSRIGALLGRRLPAEDAAAPESRRQALAAAPARLKRSAQEAPAQGSMQNVQPAGERKPERRTHAAKPLHPKIPRPGRGAAPCFLETAAQDSMKEDASEQHRRRRHMA